MSYEECPRCGERVDHAEAIEGRRPMLHPRAELERVIEKLGPDLWRNDPLINQALASIAHGTSTEDALMTLVRAFAELNARLVKRALKLEHGPRRTLSTSPALHAQSP